MPKILTAEQKLESDIKRKAYLKEYMRKFMKDTYGEAKRNYNRETAKRLKLNKLSLAMSEDV